MTTTAISLSQILKGSLEHERNWSEDHIRVEKRLFCSLAQAQEAVNAFYTDKYAALEGETGHEWAFHILPTTQQLPQRDPHLVANLEQQFGLTLADIPAFASLEYWGTQRIPFLMAFNHGWALWAWSKWCQAHPQLDHPAPLLLHLDAHADLETPPLHYTTRPGLYLSGFGQQLLHLNHPEEVRLGLLRGAIGIGSFIVPFLHTHPAVDMLHFSRQAPLADGAVAVENLILTHEPLPTPWGILERPAVTHIRTEPELPCPRLITSNDLGLLPQLSLEQRPLFLDIDLDFFCNQFDNNISNSPTEAVTTNQLLDHMGVFLDGLSQSSLLNKVAVVTVALSPGFFPSDMWQAALGKLLPALRHMFESCSALQPPDDSPPTFVQPTRLADGVRYG